MPDRNSFDKHISQKGKYNIVANGLRDVHIGDKIYTGGDDASVRRPLIEICENRLALVQYLEVTLGRLKQAGCLDVHENVPLGNYSLSYAAKIENFELSFRPVNLRGDAFFGFAEFRTLELTALRQFSGQMWRWAKSQVTPGAAWRAVYNARIPAHFCFAIALVDALDEATRHAIRTTNPLDHSLDVMWYEMPLVYELDQQQLYFYNQPSGFLENFKGEIAWKPIREQVHLLLSTSTESSQGKSV